MFTDILIMRIMPMNNQWILKLYVPQISNMLKCLMMIAKKDFLYYKILFFKQKFPKEN
jgi:hypothetical protein